MNGIGGCFRGRRRSILSRSLVVVVRFFIRRCLVECTLACDHEVVFGLGDNYLVGFFYFGSGCYYFIDDYEVGFLCSEIPSTES